MTSETQSALDFLLGHNAPEPCLDPGCPFCEAWDCMTTEQFTEALVWLADPVTDMIQ